MSSVGSSGHLLWRVARSARRIRHGDGGHSTSLVLAPPSHRVAWYRPSGNRMAIVVATSGLRGLGLDRVDEFGDAAEFLSVPARVDGGGEPGRGGIDSGPGRGLGRDKVTGG